MSHSKNSDGKIVMHYDGISYLCETRDHKNCGGFCGCKCHNQPENKEK